MADLTRWDFGGGAYPRPGFFVVDFAYSPDLVWDLRVPFPPEYHGVCIDGKFYHGPEHYSRYEIAAVLHNIWEVMAPGGELEIRCPDMDLWAREWGAVGATQNTLGCIFGGQVGEGQVHYNGLNFDYLERLLTEAGFTHIHRASPSGAAPEYDFGSSSDPNRRLDLHVICRCPIP